MLSCLWKVWWLHSPVLKAGNFAGRQNWILVELKPLSDPSSWFSSGGSGSFFSETIAWIAEKQHYQSLYSLSLGHFSVFPCGERCAFHWESAPLHLSSWSGEMGYFYQLKSQGCLFIPCARENKTRFFFWRQPLHALVFFGGLFFADEISVCSISCAFNLFLYSYNIHLSVNLLTSWQMPEKRHFWRGLLLAITSFLRPQIFERVWENSNTQAV